MFKRIGLVVMVLILAAGCSKFTGAGDPKEVAEKFWSGSRSGDIEKVKPYVTKDSFATLQSGKEGGLKKGEYKLGTAVILGDRATIPTTLTEKDFSMQLQTILVKEGGKWKVDVNQTMTTMVGGAVEQMFKAMGEGMGEAMKGLSKGMEGMGKGMGEAMKGFEEGMKAFGKSMEKAMGKETGKSLEEADKALEEAAKVEPKQTAKATAEEAPAEAVPPTKSFKTGDKVLVEWHKRWWPATVVEAKPDKWYIHYDGYAKSWDEWVGPERIREK